MDDLNYVINKYLVVMEKLKLFRSIYCLCNLLVDGWTILYDVFRRQKKADIHSHRQKDILFYYYIRCDQLGNQDVTYFTVYTGWLFVGILMKTKGGKG